ncbi:MAG: hypothetical protein EP330_03525 [Deltaproteobacteria bacterium]|nr:MAG: hypothetical protein EP330_03525 [Deltaproteobacteria bacterium]
MILGVGDIPVNGRRLSLDGEAWAVAAGRDAAGGEVSSVTGELVLHDAGAGVLRVTGTAALVAELDCDRCGESTSLQVEAEVDLGYAPVVARRTTSLDEEEVELAEDELDAGWYEGTTLDMHAVLCEAFTLAWPARVVCSDSTACEQRASTLLDAGKAETSPFAALRGLADA